MRWTVLVAAAAVVTAGCETEETEQVRNESEITQAAERQYDPTAYDTVVWSSDSAAIARGRDIFTWVCAECHGERGLGDAGRVVDGDTLHPPSFQQEDWPYADDPDALHRKVFVGNTLGMPHWGLRQMQPRDIVAVERYIRLDLRDDAPSEGDSAPGDSATGDSAADDAATSGAAPDETATRDGGAGGR